MKNINEVHEKSNLNVKLIQFGEGNFLRAFVDEMIDITNKKGLTDIGIAIVKPISFGSLEQFNIQNGIYTVLLQGKKDNDIVKEAKVITSIQDYIDCYKNYDEYMNLAKSESLRFVVSNTTEAGIVFDDTDKLELCPPNSYPGKLTKFLYERYQTFGGEKSKGLIILPVELIEANGKKLKECILKLIDVWNLPSEFRTWVIEANIFCSTLVDRIVTGYPSDNDKLIFDELGYKDQLLVTGEPFAFWVIESECPEIIQNEFPLDLAGLPVLFTKDQKPYRERKVRLLNGAHTGTIMAAYLKGLRTVSECMSDKAIRAYIEKLVYDEISKTVDLPENEVKEFADSVMERFENPFIRHELMSIALNSVSKWKTRNMPSLVDYYTKSDKLPKCLTFSFAAMLAFYTSNKLTDKGLECVQGSEKYTILDDRYVLEFFVANSNKEIREYVELTCKNEEFWGTDLDKINGFTDTVCVYLESIRTVGIDKTIQDKLLDNIQTKF